MNKPNWRVFYMKNGGLWQSKRMPKREALDLMETFLEAIYIQKVSGWFRVGRTINKRR